MSVTAHHPSGYAIEHVQNRATPRRLRHRACSKPRNIRSATQLDRSKTAQHPVGYAIGQVQNRAAPGRLRNWTGSKPHSTRSATQNNFWVQVTGFLRRFGPVQELLDRSPIGSERRVGLQSRELATHQASNGPGCTIDLILHGPLSHRLLAPTIGEFVEKALDQLLVAGANRLFDM